MIRILEGFFVDRLEVREIALMVKRFTQLRLWSIERPGIQPEGLEGFIPTVLYPVFAACHTTPPQSGPTAGLAP